MIVIGFIAAIVVPVFMVLWGVRLRKNPPAYLQGRLSFRTKSCLLYTSHRKFHEVMQGKEVTECISAE